MAQETRKVQTQHASYKARSAQWRRCRDCYDGSDAIKADTIAKTYLPPLDVHRAQEGEGRYQGYKTRAMFFNAMARTIDGLAGAIFQKEPKVDVPDAFKPVLDDATLRGEPAELVALIATREVMITGRYGVLVDVTSGTKPRAYLTGYKAEDIVNWRETRTGDDPAVLSLVVLREDELVERNGDEFDLVRRDSYRVLRMVGGVYTTEQWREREQPGMSVTLYEPGEQTTPTRRGKPLDFIPFTFVGPTSTTVDAQKPPMLDLADVNLSHYRTSADLESGRHYVALPTPWMAGASADQTGELILGPSGMLMLDKGGVAGMLEFSGSGLGSLEKADDTKRQMMAVLGARLLEDSGGPAETATAVNMKHAGEHASLRTIAASIERAFEEIFRTGVWWTVPTAGEKWADIEVAFELNKDYFNVKMPPEMAKTLVLMLQAEAISYETFWTALVTGNFIEATRTAEEEKKKIEREKPAPPPPPPGAPAPGGTGLPGGTPGLPPGPGGLKPKAPPAGGAPAAPPGGPVKIPAGTHLVRDAGAPGVPHAQPKVKA